MTGSHEHKQRPRNTGERVNSHVVLGAWTYSRLGPGTLPHQAAPPWRSTPLPVRLCVCVCVCACACVCGRVGNTQGGSARRCVSKAACARQVTRPTRCHEDAICSSSRGGRLMGTHLAQAPSLIRSTPLCSCSAGVWDDTRRRAWVVVETDPEVLGCLHSRYQHHHPRGHCGRAISRGGMPASPVPLSWRTLVAHALGALQPRRTHPHTWLRCVWTADLERGQGGVEKCRAHHQLSRVCVCMCVCVCVCVVGGGGRAGWEIVSVWRAGFGGHFTTSASGSAGARPKLAKPIRPEPRCRASTNTGPDTVHTPRRCNARASQAKLPRRPPCCAQRPRSRGARVP